MSRKIQALRKAALQALVVKSAEKVSNEYFSYPYGSRCACLFSLRGTNIVLLSLIDLEMMHDKSC